MCTRLLVFILVACNLAPAQVLSATVTIPAGTKLMGELDQQVTSNPRKFEVGDIVRGHVWRNVIVDGHTVIEAGAPLTLRISDLKKRRIAGRGGDVEIRAVSVTAADGTEIFLDGGYDKQASHRTALSASLSALVFWPAIFIRGKEAVLEAGTIFDASVPANTRIDLVGESSRTIRLSTFSGMNAEILYDDIDDTARHLPMRVTLCDRSPLDSVHVDAVNDAPVESIAFVVDTTRNDGNCHVATGSIDLKALGEHFRRGINRFTLSTENESTEVILDIEM